jgi:hypothetical protein
MMNIRTHMQVLQTIYNGNNVIIITILVYLTHILLNFAYLIIYGMDITIHIFM